MLPAPSPAVAPKRGATVPKASKRREDLPAVPSGRKPKPVAVSTATVVKGLGEDVLDGVLAAVAPQQFTSYVLQSTSVREKVVRASIRKRASALVLCISSARSSARSCSSR